MQALMQGGGNLEEISLKMLNLNASDFTPVSFRCDCNVRSLRRGVTDLKANSFDVDGKEEKTVRGEDGKLKAFLATSFRLDGGQQFSFKLDGPGPAVGRECVISMGPLSEPFGMCAGIMVGAGKKSAPRTSDGMNPENWLKLFFVWSPGTDWAPAYWFLHGVVFLLCCRTRRKGSCHHS